MLLARVGGGQPFKALRKCPVWKVAFFAHFASTEGTHPKIGFFIAHGVHDRIFKCAEVIRLTWVSDGVDSQSN